MYDEAYQKLQRLTKTKTLYRLSGDAPGTWRTIRHVYDAGVRKHLRTKYGAKLQIIANEDLEKAVEVGGIQVRDNFAELCHQMAPQKAYRSGDFDIAKPMREKVAAVRGGMVGAAESVPVPDRFYFEDHPTDGAMILTDMETGRHCDVALCDYRGVRELLAALFG